MQQKHLDYLKNVGGPIAVELFDEDWSPIGSIVREELVKRGLAVEKDGKISLVPKRTPAFGYPRFHAEEKDFPGSTVNRNNQQKGNMPRPKQKDLPAMNGPGVEGPQKYPDIEIAADKYIDVRDKRMSWTEKEVGQKAILIAKMQEHGLTTYRFGDHEVQLSESKLKVKVKTVGMDGETDDDDE